MKFVQAFVAGLAGLSLMGCAATSTLISKRHLDVQTKMSDSIFLDPVAPTKRVVYISSRNTSDKSDFVLQSSLIEKLKAAGYRVTDNPDIAHYLLQVNTLSVGKMDPTAAEANLNAGFGGPLTAAALAYATGTRSGRGLAAAGVAGAAVEWVSGLLVKDISYASITDIQVSERSQGTVRSTSKHQLKQGSSGSTTSYHEEESNWKRYQTRVVSVANKANLTWELASPEMIDGVSQSISGLF